MLEIEINSGEFYDSKSNRFYEIEKSQILKFEHSLVSVSKWEQKNLKPFLSEKKKTQEEVFDYVKCMSLDKNISDDIFRLLLLDKNKVDKIVQYIDYPASATTFYNNRPNGKGKSSQKVVTSEYIYYMMMRYGIPIECQKWHLNRLMALIRIFGIEMSKGSKGTKMSVSETAQQYRSLNEQRKAALNTNG